MKSRTLQNFIRVSIFLIATTATNSYSQKVDANQVICFKSQIKNPYSFLGLSGESIELTDGSSWKVTNSNYMAASSSAGTVLACPSIGKMFIASSAISIEKTTKKSW